ncbi:MAG: hypothetical protein NC388_03660 [Clostridium sp.]|nr:hypothetical protein [Clostridium sp.]
MEEPEKIDMFKKNFTQEELDEIVEWLEQRMDRLPQSMHLDKATWTDDLPKTVRSYIRMMKGRKPTTTVSGYIAQMLVMRKRLQQMGVE